MSSRLPLFALVAILAALWVGFAPLMGELRQQWNDGYGPLSHAYLVFAIAAWLAVRAWRANGGPPPTRAWWPALVPLVAFIAIGVLAEALFIGTSRSIVLPPLVLSAVALAFGLDAARRLAWPILFCYFGLSVWNPLNPLLQKLTTSVSSTIVHLSGVPAYVEGNYVHLTSGLFEIASGCAGLNYFIVALTIGATAATLYLRQTRSRVTLLVATAVAGVVANWVRVSSLIMIGHATKMQHYLIRVDHLAYGWVLFMVTLVPVALLLRRLQAREDGATVDGDEEITGVARTLRPSGPVAASVAALVVALGLLAAPALSRSGSAGSVAGDEATAWPGATPVSRFASGWEPAFVDAREFRGVAQDGTEAFVASYPRQRPGAQVFDSANRMGGHRWQLASSEVRELADGRRITEEQGSLGGRRFVLWTWYEVGGREVADKGGFRRAVLQGLSAGRRDARAFGLLRDCAGDCAAAATTLESVRTK